MTTADTPVVNRRHRPRRGRADARSSSAGRYGSALERQQLLLSLQVMGCVALTLFFLRLGVPGAAFVFLSVGVLLLGRTRPG